MTAPPPVSHPSAVPAFVVTVRFVVHPEFRDQFHALVLRNAAQSRELEAGCIRFDVLTPHDPDAAGDVFLYELYDSEAAFEDHLNMRHFIDFDLVTRPMALSKEVIRYDALVPARGAMAAERATR